MLASHARIQVLFKLVMAFAFLLVSVHPIQAQTFAPVPGLAFVKKFAGADPLPQTVTIASTSTNFDFSHTEMTTSGGSWLSVSVTGFNCCATPRAITVVVTTSPSMAVGTYTGQINLASFPSGTITMSIPVMLTVEPAGGTFFDDLQGQVSFSLLTSGTAITSQSVEIRNGGSGTLNWSLAKSTSDGGNWLTASASSGTAPSLLTVGVSVADLPGGGLIAGHFIGELVLSQGSGGSVTIPVSVVVGAANVFSQVNPINFTKVFGGADPLPQTLSIASLGPNFNFDIDWYNSNGGAWLSTSAFGFNCCTTPRALTAIVTTSPTLAVGKYTGQIVVTVEGNGSMAMTIPVTLTVEPAGGTFFDNLQGQVSFSLATGGTAITSQSVEIRNGGSGALNWSLAKSTSDGGNWLTASASSGTAPSLLTVGVSVANLPGGGLIAGHFIGELVLSQGSGGSVTIPVSVVVGGANVFSQVNPINFTKVFGGPDPLPQTLSIASLGPNFNFDINSYNSNGGTWLSVSAFGFNCCTTPRALTAIVTTSPTLAVGTYTGQIVVTVEGNGSMAMTIPVTLTVEPVGGTFFNDMPGQMSFSFVTGSGNPPSQNVQIGTLGPGTLNWTLAASTSDGGNWLTVSANGGTAPSTVTVGVVANALPSGGLVAGNFVGNLVFRSATGSMTIPVSVTVGANVFVQLPSLAFTKALGAANPAAQNLNIASTGTNFNFDFSGYNATGGAWLSVSSPGFNCCTTPRTLVATIVASPSLAAGTYVGQIVVTVEGNGSSAMTIPVTLTVAEPVATLDVDASITSTEYDALTDGLLIQRYLSGLTGSSLTAHALGHTATRTDPAGVKTYLDAIRSALDIDGDGHVDLLTDGVLIIRYLSGFRGDALINGAVTPNAPRSTAQQIEDYIQSLMP